MDHNQAIKLDAVERYLLEEMTPQERDDFEEHYFDCHDCATELRATAAFMDAAGQELKANPVPQPKKATNGGNGKSFFASLWPTMLVWSALAASLLVIVYQNAVVFPRFQTQIAELRAPEVLPVVSLVRLVRPGLTAPIARDGAPPDTRSARRRNNTGTTRES